jgi:hypothetical protein
MIFHAYLNNGIVYVPTVARLKTGAYMNVEPVAVVPVTDTARLRQAFSETIARGNTVIPNPPKDDWPPSVIAKYARVKTWSAFARGAAGWSIEETDGHYQIGGYRDHPDGYWAPDPAKKIDFPTGSRVEIVIERMIAILQQA